MQHGPLPVPQFAHAEHREHRRVAGQDAEIALGPGDFDLVHLRLVHERTFAGDDLQVQLRR